MTEEAKELLRNKPDLFREIAEFSLGNGNRFKDDIWNIIKNSVRKPLFKYEDTGKDGYEGDKAVIVNTSWAIGEEKPVTKQGHEEHGEWRKYFSNKQIAEEYVVYNKPCISYGDIIRISEKRTDATRKFVVGNLYELVKSKL